MCFFIYLYMSLSRELAIRVWKNRAAVPSIPIYKEKYCIYCSCLAWTKQTTSALSTLNPHIAQDSLTVASAQLGNGGQIEWGPCPKEVAENSTLTLECGTLAVPRDYMELNSTSTHTLELIKTPAQSKHAKGTVILNFGGPGAESLKGFAKNVPSIQQ